MKRALLYGMMLLWACIAAAQGIPFIKNYTPDDYHAHNRNFDVVTTDDGISVIEAIERTDQTFALGVHYHPEEAVRRHLDHAADEHRFMSLDEGLAYFRALINATKFKHELH